VLDQGDAALFAELLKKSQLEGALSVAASQTGCEDAERRLAGLEGSSTFAPLANAPALAASQPSRTAAEEGAAAVRGVTSNARSVIAVCAALSAAGMSKHLRAAAKRAFAKNVSLWRGP